MCHRQLFPDFAPRGPKRVRGLLLDHRNRPKRSWSGQLHIRNVSNCGLHFKFRENEARFEQADHGYQDPLEIFDVRWNAGVNASRGSGEKLREPTISGLTEFADEDAEYFALGYLEALGLLNELAIHVGRFHAEYDLLLTPDLPISAFEAGCEVPVGSPHRRWTSWTPFTYPFVEVPMDVGGD